VRHDHGSVSAEFAVTLPAVFAALTLVLGALGVAGDQAWLTGASAWVAREVATGVDQHDAIRSVVRGHRGIESEVELGHDQVCVTLVRAPTGPLALLGVSATGRACVRRVL